MPAANEYPVLHLMSGVPDASCNLLHFMSAKRTLHLQIQKIMYAEIGEIMLMYGREAQSKTKTASPATIPKSGERNRKIHSCMLYLISI